MALTLLSANNASTVLSAGISASATTLTVNTGTGGLFPSPVSGTSFFKLTLIDAATGTLTEIVHVTARTGDTMTIVRGQEGTVSRLWSANDIAANMMTAGTLDLFAQSGTLGGAALLNVGTTAGTVAAGNDSRITGALQKSANLSDLANAQTALTNLGGLKTTNNLSEIAAAGSAAQAAARGNLGVVSTDKKQLVTAWVNFSVSGGVVTINDSFNVSSVVRTATGRFNVFFTNAMINSFYCPAVISRRSTGASSEDGICYGLGSTNRAMNATQFPISINNAAGTAEDPLFCCVSVSGGV